LQGHSLDNYNAISSLPSSDEGRTIFFTALAATEEQQISHECESPLLGNEVYARIGGAKTVPISEPSHEDCELCDTSEAAQLLAPRGALFQGASADGSKVFFISEQKLFSGTRGESGTNLYEYDFAAANSHERISLLAPALAPGGGVVRVTEDGSRVYLVSEATLAGTGQNEYGTKPAVGADNLYSYDTRAQQAAFVAALSPEDGTDWQADDARGVVQATADGRFLLFSSINDLTPDALGETSQLYRYDASPTAAEEAARVPRLVRVSVGDTESNDGNSAPFFAAPGQVYDGPDKPARRASAMSADGSKVFFETSAALTPEALNEVCIYEVGGECFAKAFNVYEYEAGNVFLLSSGKDVRANAHGTATTLVDVSSSGADVFMTSDDALTGGTDSETGQDNLYDIRVGGGFPVQKTSPSCSSECQEAAASPPSFGSPGSMYLTGSGNSEPSTTATPLLAPRSRKTPAQVRAQKLVKALKACRKQLNRRRRVRCEKVARKRYGARRQIAHRAPRGARR
jgi:hypothetical protein